MDRRFACTACGKCCSGWIPLTIEDVIKHAERFPIAMVWTPIGPKNPTFNHTARLFTTCRSPGGGRLALRIVPTAYIPPTVSCPELTADGLCGIHSDKPLRCRSMPFFPYRDEGQQDELLRPRSGWDCDVSENAPVVYRGWKIIDRSDFDAELAVIRRETPTIKKYACHLIASAPQLETILHKTSQMSGGNVILNFLNLFQIFNVNNIDDIAKKQLRVLDKFMSHIAGEATLTSYHQRYAEWRDEWLSQLAHPSELTCSPQI